MESVRLLPSTLLSWEVVLGKVHSGGTNSYFLTWGPGQSTEPC